MKPRFFTSSKASLKRHTLYYGIATLIERFISFLILPILTKALPQEFYGIWTQIIVTTGLLSGIFLMGFQTATIRFLAGKKDNFEISNIFHIIASIVLLNCLIFISFTYFFTSKMSYIIFGSIIYSKFIILFGFYLTSEVFYELTTAFLRAREEIKLLSIYYILKNAMRAIILGLGIIIWKLDLFQVLLIIIIIQFLLVLRIYFKDILPEVGFCWSLKSINKTEIFRFSIPLIPYGILIWLNNFVNRYFILHIFNIKQVSVYAVAYSLAAITGLFYSVISYTVYSRMANLWNNGDKQGVADVFCKAIKYYLFFAIPFISVITILSSPLIRLLSTAEYISNWQVVFGLSISILIFGIYQLSTYILLLANKTIFNLIVSVVAVLVNVIFNIVFIPIFGILGAVISVCISNSILTFWTIMVGKKYLLYSFRWAETKNILFATFIMSTFLISARRFLCINKFHILFLTIILAGIIYGLMDLKGKNSIILQLKKNI